MKGDANYLESPMATPEAGEALICDIYSRSGTCFDGINNGLVPDL